MKDAPEVYGTVTIGERGQVVIPIEARKALKIKPGDKLMVMSGPPGRAEMISFIPVSRISHFLRSFERHISELKAKL
ncbi:MAG: AbrB/MazE/SpoVT family DNA-binding domain-containing protein [Candidatus Omnitrophica bacterium]|nr:AbrB/MazE/SpoVT family DNA-binding domain-containing protein [Candidatus Omnitrophota bacterium]